MQHFNKIRRLRMQTIYTLYNYFKRNFILKSILARLELKEVIEKLRMKARVPDYNW